MYVPTLMAHILLSGVQLLTFLQSILIPHNNKDKYHHKLEAQAAK